jgi:hypothetical protein
MRHRPSLQSPLLNSKDNKQNIVQTTLQDRKGTSQHRLHNITTQFKFK